MMKFTIMIGGMLLCASPLPAAALVSDIGTVVLEPVEKLCVWSALIPLVVPL
jgi:hypothetical protein